MNSCKKYLAGTLFLLLALFFPFDPSLTLVDNSVQFSVAIISAFYAGQPPKTPNELERLRSYLSLVEYIPRFPWLETRDIEIPRAKGEGKIPVRLVWPREKLKKSKTGLPLIVYFHYGGFVLGSHKEPLANVMADDVEAIVASVGYRLAPEHKFPAGVDDCWEALCWLSENAESLGADPTNIAIAGASAGGNLAAVMGLKARDNKLKLKGQAILVPMMRWGAQTESMYKVWTFARTYNPCDCMVLVELCQSAAVIVNTCIVNRY